MTVFECVERMFSQMRSISNIGLEIMYMDWIGRKLIKILLDGIRPDVSVISTVWPVSSFVYI